MKNIIIYDTTLRDGNQAEDVNLTLEDKIKIALQLDKLGVSYIEGGWPGASPVDTAFFKEIRSYSLRNAKIAAFGSTHHPQYSASADDNLNAIIAAKPDVASIFGKTWEQHVTEALRIPSKNYFEIVKNSITILKAQIPQVFYDAEHFFDGYYHNREFAMMILRAAIEGGADAIVLCDTNGGMLPSDISKAVDDVKTVFSDTIIGIHTHNDSELAVANTINAVKSGATMIQGTVNGIGERCGNANLSSIIPVLELKYDKKYQCLPKGNLPLLKNVSNYVAEVANISLFSRQPFIGRSAFAHKGGVHVSAVSRNSSLYEHISPSSVGNEQRILLTELAGRSNIVSLAKKFGFHLNKDEPVVKGLLVELKDRASFGYDYATAEASIELLLLKKLGRRGVRDFFKLIQFRVLETKLTGEGEPTSEATVTIEVEGAIEHTAAFGQGPINALDIALRKALSAFYPKLQEMKLVDFKVRVLSANETNEGTASLVRVLIESSSGSNKWVTVGVSHNIIDASWQALADSITYKLYKDENEYRKKLIN